MTDERQGDPLGRDTGRDHGYVHCCLQADETDEADTEKKTEGILHLLEQLEGEEEKRREQSHHPQSAEQAQFLPEIGEEKITVHLGQEGEFLFALR